MNTKAVRNSIKGLPARRRMGTTVLALCMLGLGSCGGSSGPAKSGEPPGNPPPASATLDVYVVNVLSEPVAGAAVTVDAGGSPQQETTAASGVASFSNLPTGQLAVSVGADGFESQSTSMDLVAGTHSWEFTLEAVGAWAVGRALILGTEVLERAADGSSMTFSVDVAVIAGENGEPLEALADADFRLYIIDCGWGGPRDCASDAAGNATRGSGVYSTDGVARAFELQPPAAQHSYLLGILAERSGTGDEWEVKGPPLKSFFTALGGNDAVGLASVQVEDENTTLTVLGEFTSDGSGLNDAVDRLGNPAGDQPFLHASLLDSIRWTAAAMNEFPGKDATLLVLSTPYLSVAEIDETVTLARQSGVRVSTVTGWSYGLPEVAVRTGGFVASLDDLRQFGMVFGAMDHVLGATLPNYRMQFRLTALPDTFVPGGNVKTRMHIDMPVSVINRGVHAEFDIAIP